MICTLCFISCGLILTATGRGGTRFVSLNTLSVFWRCVVCSVLHSACCHSLCFAHFCGQVIMKPIRNRDERGFARLQAVLETILLRRTKTQRINNGKSMKFLLISVKLMFVSPGSILNSPYSQSSASSYSSATMCIYGGGTEILLRSLPEC